MLQQILRDMYIEADLLAELSDEQKQILFLKMREEQIRRWNKIDDQVESEERRKPRPKRKQGGKKAQFLQGSDGHEWVWVMGEHLHDKTVEQILEEEAHAQARQLAEQEAQLQRQREEEELQRKIAEEQRLQDEEREKQKRLEEEAALYQSIKEARIAAQKMEDERIQLEAQRRQKIKHIQDVAELERRKSQQNIDNVKKRRSDEIYIRWKEMRRELEKVSEETSKEVEKNWVEQERRSKVAEEEMRDIARRAREENRFSLMQASKLIMNANRFTAGEKPPLPPKSSTAVDKTLKLLRSKRPPRPPNKESVVEWFHLEEKAKKTVIDDSTGKVSDWFHGVISRMDAEKLLLNQPLGSFLVRVSEKVWGYTISYRAQDRCKHFLIDASEDNYHFFGPSQLVHSSITELVNFHKENPVTMAGGEKMLYPCGQDCDPPDYWDLFQNRRTESTAL